MRIQVLAAGIVLGCACAGLSSCGPSGSQSEPKTSEPATGAASAPAPKEVPPPEPLLTGSYEAVSNTAMGITGDLMLAADRLSFELDQTCETKLVAHRPGTEDYAKGAGSFAAVLLIPESAKVEVRQVSTENVGPKARNGGLCSPSKTTFIALASATDSTGEAALKLAAFKGAAPPGPNGDPADLCGTFNYVPARPKE